MRAAALLTGIDTHLDHLGVLSALLGIPLIVTEERIFQLAKKFYPSCAVELLEPSALSLKFLAEHFDVLFETGRFFAAELSFPLQLFHNKTMRFVHCPHGNSDKGLTREELACQDIALFYGEHQRALLEQTGALAKTQHCIRTGNYRFAFYREQRAFYDDITEREVFHHFPRTRPIGLYAPTWNSKEHPSSFFDAAEYLITALKEDFNLLIKVHPYLIEQHPAAVFALENTYAEDSAVHFLNDFPPIYPLLAKSAFYIGDYSSVGYDFLAFDKPLFFLLPQSDTSPLRQCGIVLSSKDPNEIRKRVLSHLEKCPDSYSSVRCKTYLHAFGEEKTKEILCEDIFTLIHA